MWAQAPVLSQWAKVVRQGTPITRQADRHTGKPTFVDFMFDPAKFSDVDITRLWALCVAPVASVGQIQVRDGTDDEWAVRGKKQRRAAACQIFLSRCLKVRRDCAYSALSRAKWKGNVFTLQPVSRNSIDPADYQSDS